MLRVGREGGVLVADVAIFPVSFDGPDLISRGALFHECQQRSLGLPQ